MSSVTGWNCGILSIRSQLVYIRNVHEIGRRVALMIVKGMQARRNKMDRRNNFAEKALARSASAVQSKPPASAEPSTDADFKSFVLYVSSAEKRNSQCIKALNVEKVTVDEIDAN